MTQVTINGNTYSDDGSTAKDMLNGGHRLHFFPLVQDIVTTAAEVEADRAAAAISETNALNVATAMKGTSTTSNTIGTGSKSFTTNTGKQFTVGNYVTIARTSAPVNLMHGIVTAYNSGTGALTVDVTSISGSGTYTDWSIAVSGATGAVGLSGDGSVTYMSLSTGATLTASDKAKIIDCTGTFTVSFQAAATLGSSWTTVIRNVGTGTITLDPNASELIDGSSTFLLLKGNQVRVSSNGTELKISMYQPNILASLPILRNNSPLTAKSSNEVIETVINIASGTYTIQNIYNTTLGLLAVPNVAGVCFTSTDGVTWIERSIGFSNTINDDLIAVFGNTILMYVSTTSACLSTDGGITWSSQTLPATPIAISNSSNTFILVSGYTSYYTSTTGTTGSWTTRSYALPNTNTIAANSGMAYLSTTLLLNSIGRTEVFTSTNNGDTWTRSSVTAQQSNPAAGAGVFVSCTSANFVSSTNGTTWTNRTALTKTINNIEFINSLFVAVGTNTIWTSSDGITWTERSTATVTHQSVAYGNSTYVSVGGSSSGTLYTSSDGITWTAQTAVGTVGFTNIKYNGSVFVITDSAGKVYTSTNGITLTDRGKIVDSCDKFGLTVNGSTFVISSDSLPELSLYTSTDGITWTLKSESPFGVSLSGIFYLNSTYHVYTATCTVKSTDLNTWTGSVQSNCDIMRKNVSGKCIAVYDPTTGADRRIIWYTTDGITWTLKFIPKAIDSGALIKVNPDGELNYVTPAGNYYVYSTDAVTWTSVAISLPSLTNPSIVKINDAYLALGGSQVYSASSLTDSWTLRTVIYTSKYSNQRPRLMKFGSDYYGMTGEANNTITKLNLSITGLFST